MTAKTVTPPDASTRAQAAERLAGLATPSGALGRMGELGVWLAACQGSVQPQPITNPRLVIFAGDHGVAAEGVSAYPQEITGAMVRSFLTGKAGVNALARAHGVAVRVLDLGVAEDFEDLDEATRSRLQEHKIRNSSGAIHLVDALTREEAIAAINVGRAVADDEIAAGADLIISGDMGIGNTTPAAAMIAAVTGLPAELVVGTGSGIDSAALENKTNVVAAAVARAGERVNDPIELLAALSSADLAATVGYLAQAAVRGTPVLLDGLMSVACALVADVLEPGAREWFAAGHKSTEPGQAAALKMLGLDPIVDMGMRLGEGSGAVVAVPTVNAAGALLREVALLSDLSV